MIYKYKIGGILIWTLKKIWLKFPRCGVMYNFSSLIYPYKGVFAWMPKKVLRRGSFLTRRARVCWWNLAGEGGGKQAKKKYEISFKG